MSSARKCILSVCVAGIAISSAWLVARDGLPSFADFVGEMTTRDPIMAWLLPKKNSGQLQSQANPDYVLEDAPGLYNLNRAGDVVTLLVEVYDDKEHSMSDFGDPVSGVGLRLPAIVREGTNLGTVKWEGLGYSAVAANATIEVRGVPNANRRYQNFKLRLENAAGQYEGQSILNLKKAYAKPCRVEEKFAFDLFSTLPDMLSLRTKFVHLYIWDRASESGYADYGLYTMVEQPDRSYFTNRSLDDAGNLYQAENFDFSLSPVLLQITDPAYDRDAFELVLDIKQGDSHQNLIDMLEAVNDKSADIDLIIDDYFDRDNLLSWMAMNVILGNADCVTRGYMIYKPTLSSRWFFLPYNMSDAMPAGGDDGIADVMISGCSMFYGNILYERFLSKPENVSALDERVDALMEVFTESNVRRITDQYIPVLARYLTVNPDLGILKTSPVHVQSRVAGYHRNMQLNVEAFRRNLESPRRVELLESIYRHSAVTLVWTPSRQLGGGAISYRVEVSDAPEFTRLLRDITVVDADRAELTGLPKGQLYWRVTATDSEGRQAGSANVTELQDGIIIYGSAAFRVI